MLNVKLDAIPDDTALRPRADGRPPPLKLATCAVLLDSYVTIVR
jgi:hypothetical protein